MRGLWSGEKKEEKVTVRVRHFLLHKNCRPKMNFFLILEIFKEVAYPEKVMDDSFRSSFSETNRSCSEAKAWEDSSISHCTKATTEITLETLKKGFVTKIV